MAIDGDPGPGLESEQHHRPLFHLPRGEAAFSAYEAAFDQIYRSGPVIDVLKRRVIFPKYACQHVCFKGSDNDRYGRSPRTIWDQERADYIPLILPALTDPKTEVRPDHQNKRNNAYLFTISIRTETGLIHVRYYVVVSPGQRNEEVVFNTAYPVNKKYWDAAKRAGRTLYPPPAKR
jgi:hypothetical protein